MMDLVSSPSLIALLQVILIDIVLAGDNAVVIGMAAAKIPKARRRVVIFWGLVAAVVLRVMLATFTATLLDVIGLMFAGGILLLWVSWRLYRDIAEKREEAAGAKAVLDEAEHGHGNFSSGGTAAEVTGMRRAILQIIVADLSMSLDNVLAVAGAAMDHVWVLAIGLLLSIALMGVAASLIAALLQKHPWISYAGLIIVVYVALRMIYFGSVEIMSASAQPTLNNSAVASSEVLKRGNFWPAGSAASMLRNSSPSAARPFASAAATSAPAL
jgi:YjbE family integral membrane protein